MRQWVNLLDLHDYLIKSSKGICNPNYLPNYFFPVSLIQMLKIITLKPLVDSRNASLRYNHRLNCLYSRPKHGHLQPMLGLFGHKPKIILNYASFLCSKKFLWGLLYFYIFYQLGHKLCILVEIMYTFCFECLARYSLIKGK